MIYLRVFLKSGQRFYLKVDAGDFAEAEKVAKRKTKGFARAEKIPRQDYEVGLLEMDIEKADAALAAGKDEPESAGLPGLRTPYRRKPKKATSAWPNIVMGIVSFVCGIALMIFWSTRDLDMQRSITILVLCSVFLVMGLIFFVVGLLGSRDS
jgi:cytochrome bd-type quinol oxidase subunit 1